MNFQQIFKNSLKKKTLSELREMLPSIERGIKYHMNKMQEGQCYNNHKQKLKELLEDKKIIKDMLKT